MATGLFVLGRVAAGVFFFAGRGGVFRFFIACVFSGSRTERVCCCHKFISGRQIEVVSASGKPLRLVCPTADCSSTVRDWVYPNEIAQPPDAWGRRALRIIDKTRERFVA